MRDVARSIHEALDRRHVPALVKTSGATGLHVYVPLAPRTTFDTARKFCERIAAAIAAKHPRVVTVEREIARRGRRVYIDCLQNLRSKTLACAYSARASAFAGVSTPLKWAELETAEPRDFTPRTMEIRLRTQGDLWAELRKTRGVNVAQVA